MIKAHDEEVQISWACSAQNPDILPDSIRKEKKQTKEEKKALIKRRFEGYF